MGCDIKALAEQWKDIDSPLFLDCEDIRAVARALLKALSALEGFAEGECEYGDGCPLFPAIALNHYRCWPCLAREALEDDNAD